MLSLLCVGVAEVAVGAIVALILAGGFGGYAAHKIWAKRHGKSSCGCDCGSCSGLCACPLAKNNKESQKESSTSFKE